MMTRPRALRLLRLLLLLLSAILAGSACGGGGGGGGESEDDGLELDGGTDVTVPDGALAGADGLASGGPTITSQPDDATVTEGKIAYFAIAVHGVGPLTYQWHRDGSPIAGANGGVHATPAASLADSGATFSVTVTDDLGESTTSDRATLTVQPAP